MKKLLFLTCMFCCVKSNAQMSYLFNSEPLEKKNAFADSVKAIFPNRVLNTDSSKSFHSYSITVIDSTKRTVVFDFGKFMKGENKDLEITGVESIMRVQVYGSYLDLFTVWQSCINKNANKEQLQKNGSERATVNGCGFWFKKSNDTWSIETMYQPIK